MRGRLCHEEVSFILKRFQHQSQGTEWTGFKSPSNSIHHSYPCQWILLLESCMVDGFLIKPAVLLARISEGNSSKMRCKQWYTHSKNDELLSTLMTQPDLVGFHKQNGSNAFQFQFLGSTFNVDQKAIQSIAQEVSDSKKNKNI